MTLHVLLLLVFPLFFSLIFEIFSLYLLWCVFPLYFLPQGISVIAGFLSPF